MCKYCENHEDYYEGSLVKARISLGFGGEEYIWMLVDPDTKKLGMVVLNQNTQSKQIIIEILVFVLCVADVLKSNL